MALKPSEAALDAVYPPHATCLAEIRRDVTDAATGCGADAFALQQIGLAVSEAATNAILHAYPRREPGGDLRVRVRHAGGEFLDVSVCDEGVGLAPVVGPAMGLGVSLMAHEAHSFEIRTSPEDGTKVVLRFRIATAGQG
jgi:anti-sigma regulatory factor (Ser/Thr protein kinase)